MRRRAWLAVGWLVCGIAASAPGAPLPTTPEPAPSSRWPLILREGIPATLPGWTSAPSDPLPDEDENAMGRYVEVSRFFQRIESPTSTKQFRVAVQDYGAGSDVLDAIRKAVAAAAATGVETRSLDLDGRRAFVVTDRSTGKPTTMVTVLLSPGRLVLGQGANVAGDEALKLLRSVDFSRIAAARDSGKAR